MAERAIILIDKALARYYAKKGVQYYDNNIGKFIAYCDDNGLDDDDIENEFAEAPEDSLLVDFDDSFPGIDNKQNKPAAILRILKRCRDDETAYINDDDYHNDDDEKHICTNEHWNITQKDLETTVDVLKAQCPVLFDSKFEEDLSLLTLLTVGMKINKPYLLYLVDMLQREKIEHHNEPNMRKLWEHSNRHLKYLKSIDVTGKESPYNAAVYAVRTSYRIAPPLMLSPSHVIMESLEQTSEYIAAAVDFVAHLAKEKKTSCPFQFDAVFAFNDVKPAKQQHLSDNDDYDDDDDEEEKDPFYDCFGAVKKKFDAAKLKYLAKDVNVDQSKSNTTQRIFKVQFSEFKKEQQFGDDYPRRKRFCAFVDRRKPDKPDEIIIFEPPVDCNTFPKGVVEPLFYFNASRTCIIPKFGYYDSKLPNNSTNEQDKSIKEKELEKTIDASSSCNGAMMLLSFHVESTDEIRCYLYLNGQCMRFFPQDIKNVLPQFFDPEYDGNSIFAASKEAKDLIDKMKPGLRDDRFMDFYNRYKSKLYDIIQAKNRKN